MCKIIKKVGNGIFALLRCYAALTGRYLTTFRYKRPIGCTEMSVPTNQRWITSKKTEDRIYTPAEA